jgi:hypothetical protein
MVLRLISCSPRGPGFLAPVIPEKLASQELGASVGASGPHDFTVRDLGVRLTRGRVHRIPLPTFVTIAKRPSSRPRDARKSARDLPDGTSALACHMLARRAICAWLLCWRDGCTTPTGSTPFALPRRRRQSSFRVRTSCVPERPLSLSHHRSRIVHAPSVADRSTRTSLVDPTATLRSQIIAWRNLVPLDFVRRAQSGPYFQGASLEICRDYDIIFVVVVTAGRIRYALHCHSVPNRRLVLCRLLHGCRVGGCRVARGADPLLYPCLTWT